VISSAGSVAAVNEDELRTSIDGPNPYKVRDLRFEWIIPDAGRLGADKSVRRSEATHARMKSSAGHRTVTKAEAEAAITECARFAEEWEQEAERLDPIKSSCSRCEQQRSYVSKIRLQHGSTVAELFLGELVTANFDLEYYVCKTCGSLEFFAADVATRYRNAQPASTAPPKEL
jgi:hypothetical protein